MTQYTITSFSPGEAPSHLIFWFGESPRVIFITPICRVIRLTANDINVVELCEKMKSAYPQYRQGGLDEAERNLSEGNQELVKRFIEYCMITAGTSSIVKIRGKMIQIADVMERALDELNLGDVRQFLAVLNRSNRATETQNDTKKVLKRFLRWQYDDWSKRFDGFRDIRSKDGLNHEKLNASTMLTANELEAMVRGADSLKYKALILLMYESAGRPEEIMKLRWRDIDFGKKEVTLFSAKTQKSRSNPINRSLPQLKRYKAECFFPAALPADYVFPQSTNRLKHLPVSTFGDFLRELGEALKFQKRLWAYLLRHSRLSKLILVLSPKVYEKFAGHSIETAMKRYAHISNSDVHDEMSEKVYQVERLGDPSDAGLQDLVSKLEAVTQQLLKRQEILELMIHERLGKIQSESFLEALRQRV